MYNLFSQEELDYLADNAATSTIKQLTEEINRLPGCKTKRTVKSVRIKIWRMGLTYLHKCSKLVDTGKVEKHNGDKGRLQVTNWLKVKKPEIKDWLNSEKRRIPHSVIMQDGRGFQALFREQKRLDSSP